MQKNNKLDFSGQEIYVGLDTGKKSWKVSILTEEFEHKTFSQPPRPEVTIQNSDIYIELQNYIPELLDASPESRA